MSATQERPVISHEEFDEAATVRLSDFNETQRDVPCAQGQVRSTEDGEDHGKAMAFTRDDASDHMMSLQS